MPSPERAPRPSPLVLACYLVYVAIGWFLSGLGSALPAIEDDVGSWSAVYPLLPGGVLVVSAALVVARHRNPSVARIHAPRLVIASLTLTAGVAVMAFTRWLPVTLAGALVAAAAAAALIRLTPGALASDRTADTERVIMRANAWSSLAGIAAPLAVGASLSLTNGWFGGLAVPIGLSAVAATVVLRRPVVPAGGSGSGSGTRERVTPGAGTDEPPALPRMSTWWREWTVLTLAITVEFCFVYYAATFLREERGLSTSVAAAGGAAWGIGMAAGRFALSTWRPPRSIVPSAIGITTGFLLLWAVPSGASAIAGIAVAGIGAAPLYPTRITALIDRFPGAPDQGAARGALASGTALVVSPALMAGVRAAGDVRTAYLVVPVVLATLVALTVWGGRRG